MIELRPYQRRADAELRAAMRQHREVLLVSPTGSGKGVLIAWMGNGAMAKGRRTLIGVPRRELLDQTVKALAACGVITGIIAAGYGENPTLPIQIATIPTLARRLDRWAAWHPDLVIIDEAHHVLAATWKAIADTLPYARLVGFTATAWRLDGRGLGRMFGAMATIASVGELIAEAWLSPLKTYCPPVLPDLSRVRVERGEYVEQDVVEALAAPRFVGDAIEHFRRYCRGSAVGYAVNVEHSRALCAAFQAAGLRAQHVEAKTPRRVRDQAIAELGEGRLDVLFNVGLFSEGLDLPALAGVLLLRPTMSLSLYLQMCGRALRPAPGKEYAVILDHCGNCLRFGLPEWDREWSLDDRPKRPGGVRPEVRRCPACGAMLAIEERVCPHCQMSLAADAEEPPVRAPGELVAVEGRTLEFLRLRKMRWREQSRWAGADYQRLLLVASVRGYRPGWAIYEQQRIREREVRG